MVKDPAYLAHITERHGKRIEQTMESHARTVATYAGDKLKSVHLYHTAYLAGLLHDMGKCTGQYQNYLERAARGEDVSRGSVNHTFSGCIYLLEQYHKDRSQGFDTLTCEILVYAMGAHHGLFDCVTLKSASGFEHRLNKDRQEISYEEAVKGFFEECSTKEEVDRLFSLAQGEVSAWFTSFRETFQKAPPVHFLLGLTARLILSAVIDGDRRDTAEFMSGTKFPDQRGSRELWVEQLSHLEEKLAEYESVTPINRARRRFSDQCRAFAEAHGGGIYRLTLPTGAGKTLASLRYALQHAETHGKKRIFFVIPLLSILEQNSQVIRGSLRDEGILIEHHSNVVKTFENQEALDPYELLTETWEAPITITTLVQLLHTLFSGQTTAVRRMSALCDAVIVIDEVQSLPKKTTNMFTMALNFLAHSCGATIVLSSATQPCFDETAQPLRYSLPTDIVPFDQETFGVFRRTEIVNMTSPYGMSMDALTDFSADLLEQVSSLLIICNTKESALKLYTALKPRCGSSRLFHLSAAMCMAHRMETLDQINTALKGRERVCCVSTQLVEAGVDFSFESVIRIAAGLDNIAQAAGRCNRSFDFGRVCRVYIVNMRKDAERLTMLQEIAAAQRKATEFFMKFAEDPARYGHDPLSEESIAEYYRLLFGDNDIKGKFSFPVTLANGPSVKLLDLLAENKDHILRPEFKGRYFLNQSFETAGDLFQVFDENNVDVIVPYDAKADEIIADLYSQQSAYDYGALKDCLERAKPYTVSIFEYQYRKLMEWGLFSQGGKEKNRFLVLDRQCYHLETGVTTENFMF